MTTTTKARTTAAEYAHSLTAQLYRAQEAEETARLAMYAAQTAAREAASAYEAAQGITKLAAPGPADLARALGWRGVGLIDDRPDHGLAWDESASVHLAAAFARGRATQTKPRNGAPKGRAYGWLPGGETVTIYEPATGTNNPEKLAQQYGDAQDALREWLADYTAEAWLSARGIDPDDAPPLVRLVSMGVEVSRRGYGDEGYTRVEWVLSLAGVPIARTTDVADILDPSNSVNGHTRYVEARERFGIPPADEDGARAWAVKLGPQMRDALIARFSPKDGAR